MLEKFLKKIGVSSYEELNAEEKETYKEWELSLSGRKLTDKDVEEWLQSELDLAVSRLTEENLTEDADRFRKVEVRFIKKIINFLNSPKVEKHFAEKAIEQLIK
jgi:hypothetical protein